MKRFFQAVPILCTLLLVGLGAFMPRIASLALDRQLAHDVALLENQSISLALEQGADFFQTLELFRSVTSQVELSEGYRMKLADAEAAAVEIRMRLAASSAAYESPEVTPVLITSKSIPGLSGVFWRCIWRDTFNDAPNTSAGAQAVLGPEDQSGAGVQEVLWLDDQSGEMVSFFGLVEWSSLSAPDSLFPQALDVAEYCRQSYPVDTVKLALTNEDKPDGQFTLTLIKSQDGHEEQYVIPVCIADKWLYFNDTMPF